MIDRTAVRANVPEPTVEEVRPKVCLDLGAGQNPREGYTPVDQVAIPGMDNIVHNLLEFPYPWDDSSVDAVHMSHVLEHFVDLDRVKILNEIHRILKPGGEALIITPCGDRHSQDPTHKGKEVVSSFYLYVNRGWLEANKLTHGDYAQMTANFDSRIDYTLHPEIAVRSDEFKRFAAQFYKNALVDMYAYLTAIK